MSLATRRGPVKAVCHEGCPGYTWPLESYFVTILGATGEPVGGYEGRLMRGPAVNHLLSRCTWGAVTPLAPYLDEHIRLRQISCAENQDGFAFLFTRTTPPGFTETWELKTCWNKPAPIPIDPNSSISCSQVVLRLPQIEGGGSTTCLIEAAYPDACDESDYNTKRQSVWHHDTPR